MWMWLKFVNTAVYFERKVSLGLLANTESTTVGCRHLVNDNAHECNLSTG